jgi:glycosyltransferase 2 family protein
LRNSCDVDGNPIESAFGFRTAAFRITAISIAGVLLWYSVRGTDWPGVAAVLVGARWPYVALGLMTATLALALRALRWRVLLNAEAHIPAATAFWATAAGYFGNTFLPARAGELVRTFMISSQSGLRASYVLATALSERIADAVMLVTIAAAVLLALPSRPAWLASAVTPFALAALAGVLGIAILPRLESAIKRVITVAPLAPTRRARLTEIFEAVVTGLRAFHDRGRLSRFLGLTTLIWLLDAVGTVIGAGALGLAMPLSVAFLLIAGLGLGSALPSTPGYVGIYQFVAVTVLSPFGFSRTAAIAYILFAQSLYWILIGFWGAIGFWRNRQRVSPHGQSVGPAGIVPCHLD